MFILGGSAFVYFSVNAFIRSMIVFLLLYRRSFRLLSPLQGRRRGPPVIQTKIVYHKNFQIASVFYTDL